MKKKIVILLLIIFIESLLFPFLTLAGDYEGYGKTIHYEGLVPCGKATSSLVTTGEHPEDPEVAERCQFCHLFVMLDGIIDFVTQKIIPPIVVLMIIIAGIMFFFGGGNPSLLLQAKKLITSVVMGLVIMFSAYLIVGTVLTAVGVQEWTTLSTWLSQGSFTVICPIEKGVAGVPPITPPVTPPITPPVTPGLLSQEEANDMLVNGGVGIKRLCSNPDTCPEYLLPGEGDCVCLEDFPASGAQKIIDLQKKSGAGITITGGTEYGHIRHGRGKSIVDLSKGDASFNTWVSNNSTLDGQAWCKNAGYTGYTMDDGSEFCDEGDHWHAEF